MRWAVAILLALGVCGSSSRAWAQAASGNSTVGQPSATAGQLRQPPVASQPTPTVPTVPTVPAVPTAPTAPALLPGAAAETTVAPRTVPPLRTPTTSAAPMGSMAGQGGLSATGSGRAIVPTAPVSAANPFASAQGFAVTTPATIGGGAKRAGGTAPARGPVAPAGKPYANFTPPSPVSPYMNLFRSDSNGANNYYSLVKPALDQRSYNQQMQRDLQSLRSTTQAQGRTLNQLNSSTNPTSALPQSSQPQSSSPQGSQPGLPNYYPGTENSSP